MSSNLLDRVLSPSALSWRYGMRLFFITVIFHVCGLLLSGIAHFHPPAGMHISDIEVLMMLLAYFVIPYWGILLLALLSNDANPMHRWRVWGAWLLMSCPFAGLYLMLLFEGNSGVGQAFAVITALAIPLSPFGTLLGAVAGYLLWHLLRGQCRLGPREIRAPSPKPRV